MQTEVIREKQLNLKLTQEELDRLQALADHHSLSPQSVIRMLLKHAYDQLATPAKPAKPRKR